ncbi:MAG: tetratricopeptide repeat protein [Fimbriimonadaceae bacterium]|nr:tetratricopeptide repeat protein [Fimbriimonadaceae bacterium]
MNHLLTYLIEVARAAALSVALAQPPSGDWLAKSRVEVRRSDHEYIERMVNDYRGFADGPSQEALFVARGIAESETFFKARDYAAAENRLRATLQGSSDNDPYLRWMLAEKLFLQKRFAECREVLAPVVHPVWDEPPLLMYAISCLQTGTDNLDIRRYIKKQAERFDQLAEFPETLPNVLSLESAIATGYYALGTRESSRFPLNVECLREAHRLLPTNVNVAAVCAGYGYRGGESAAWSAGVLKSVLPYAGGRLRKRVVSLIRIYDPRFRDGGS